VLSRVAHETQGMARALQPRTASTLGRAYEAVVYLLAFGVLINAFIAGRALIGEWDIVVHGIIGNVVFVLAVAAVVVAFLAKAGTTTIVATVALAVLVFAQVGLGYSGRNSADAMAWHIPVGVLIMGLAMWVAARASLRRAV
jgi:hypothetical protein